MTKKVKRTYFHCDLLEEAPMWAAAKSKDVELHSERSADLMREYDAFKNACRNVITQWPYSSMQNLSSRGSNRFAWIGQAACWLNHESVEYTTRIGWRLLDDDEQNQANRVANEIIEEWEQCQKSD